MRNRGRSVGTTYRSQTTRGTRRMRVDEEYIIHMQEYDIVYRSNVVGIQWLVG